MAPGFLRKIFDKVKGLIGSSDNGSTEQSSETSFSDTIKKGIDFVNDAANATNEVIDYAQPMVETVQKIVKKAPIKTKARNVPAVIQQPKPLPPPVEEIEEYEEEIYEPPPPKPKKRHSQIKERTYTNYQPVTIDSKPVIQDQNVRTKLQPILKSQKYTPVQTFSSYQSTQPPQFFGNDYSPSERSRSDYTNKWYDDDNDEI
jgi:hypothetical protein